MLAWLGRWALRCAQALGSVLYPHADTQPIDIRFAGGPARRGPGPGHPERVEPFRPPDAVERALWASLADVAGGPEATPARQRRRRG